MTRRYGLMSGFDTPVESAPNQRNPHTRPGQNYPQQYTGLSQLANNPLGVPLTIREVAQLIGCSDWTVRQRYLPQGLPHLRSGPTGKLIFYRDQVIRWILETQNKGGTY